MNYIASKIVWLVGQPLSVVFVSGILALVFGWAGARRLRAFFALVSVALLFLTLYTTMGTVLLQPLENRFERAALPVGGPGCIILLGGGIEAAVIAGRGGFEINQAGDRFVETLRLARQHPAARILISGGDGSLSGNYPGDAEVVAGFLEDFGVPRSRVIEEAESRTTFENVERTKGLLTEQNLTNCLLLTSAFHMPRAIGLFRKAGIDVLPWPADYRTSGDVGFALDFTQPSTNAQLMTTALREWLGLLAYYLAGRTHAPFPA
ncbi:YdcF family protein [Rhizobium sp. TRM95111]|uniref:YdcF family protein n=1 Tax=Rhizobium alarense TaxID=2846851 RepID=UPI001F1C8876|nr:YdcF family protein [Rhizobium alarense]MCF3638984.1 YdcF family protein [Rhizobium alarense]